MTKLKIDNIHLKIGVLAIIIITIKVKQPVHSTTNSANKKAIQKINRKVNLNLRKAVRKLRRSESVKAHHQDLPVGLVHPVVLDQVILGRRGNVIRKILQVVRLGVSITKNLRSILLKKLGMVRCLAQM